MDTITILEERIARLRESSKKSLPYDVLDVATDRRVIREINMLRERLAAALALSHEMAATPGRARSTVDRASYHAGWHDALNALIARLDMAEADGMAILYDDFLAPIRDLAVRTRKRGNASAGRRPRSEAAPAGQLRQA